MRQVIVAILVVVSFPAFAEERQFCRVQVPVNVLLDDRDHLPSLRPENIVAKVEGQRVTVKSVDENADAGHAVLILDSSGSMLSPRDKWQLALQSAREFVTLRGKQPLAAITFAAKTEQRVEFTAGPLEVERVISSQPSERKGFGKGNRRTALYDALAEAASILPADGLNSFVFVVTDAYDNESRARIRQVENLYLARRIRLFALVFTSRNPVEHDRADRLIRFAELTGGGLIQQSSRTFRDFEDDFRLDDEQRSRLSQALGAMHRRMRAPFTVEFEISAPARKTPQSLQIQILSESGKPLRGTYVAHPRKVFPCMPELQPSQR